MKPIPITPMIGERGRFVCPASDPRHPDEAYTVDLAGRQPFCNCTDFTARRLAMLKDAGRVVRNGEMRNVCKHIIAAMLLQEHEWCVGLRIHSDGDKTAQVLRITPMWADGDSDIRLEWDGGSALLYKDRIIFEE